MDNDRVRNNAVRLGDLERVVMEHLWNAAGGATVREVHSALEADREIAYTTVMTVLDRLAKKEIVTREREGRAWRYFPANSREELSAQAIRHTVDRLETDRRAAMLHFLDDATPEEIDDLKAALADVEARQAAAGGKPARRRGR
jgi:predicted transcriptional regulator